MMTRSPALLCLALLAGCAGNVADYIGPRANIVTPQLFRFGFDLREARCVGDALAGSLSPLQLRRLVRAATPVRRGARDPDRLVPMDLAHVAATVGQPVRAAVDRAMGHCDMSAERIAGGPTPDSARTAESAAPAALRPAWLNLGAAGSGQSIAVDAATLAQEAASRTAWFRLTDPGAAVPGENTYLLVIDCAARTINARSRRRRDAAGAIVEQVDYPDNPLPVENGTVMEIAFLALCT